MMIIITKEIIIINNNKIMIDIKRSTNTRRRIIKVKIIKKNMISIISRLKYKDLIRILGINKWMINYTWKITIHRKIMKIQWIKNPINIKITIISQSKIHKISIEILIQDMMGILMRIIKRIIIKNKINIKRWIYLIIQIIYYNKYIVYWMNIN
jgi:hypothetical protein